MTDVLNILRKAGIIFGSMALICGLGYMVLHPEGYRARNVTSSDVRIELSQLQNAKVVNDYRKTMGEKSCFQLPGETSKEWFAQRGCLTIKYPDRPTIFLMGDSHSASLALGLRPFAEKHQFNLLQISSGWCTPFSNVDIKCQDMNRFVHEQIRAARPDILIVDGFWRHQADPDFFDGKSDFIQHLNRGFNELAGLGAKHMIVMGQIPTWKPVLPNLLTRDYSLNNNPVPERTSVGLDAESLQMDERMRQISYPPGTTYVSLKDELCNQEGCLVKLGPDLAADLVVWDYGHMTVTGAKYITDKLLSRAILEMIAR